MALAADPAPPPPNDRLQRLMDVEFLPFMVACRHFETKIGRIVVHPTLPILYDSNFVLLKRLPGVPPDRMVETLEALARPALQAAGATHLRFVAPRPRVLHVREHFFQAGYRCTSLAILLHQGPSCRQPAPGVTIRPVESPLDEAEFNLVDTEILSEVPWGSDLIRAALRVRRAEVCELLDFTWYLATLGDQTAGSIGLLRQGLNASIQEVSTRPTFRRKSVATTMILKMIALARHAGCHEISLMVEDGSPALSLYLQLGLRVAGYVDSFLKDE